MRAAEACIDLLVFEDDPPHRPKETAAALPSVFHAHHFVKLAFVPYPLPSSFVQSECLLLKHGALVLGTKLILVPVLQLVEVSCGLLSEADSATPMLLPPVAFERD